MAFAPRELGGAIAAALAMLLVLPAVHASRSSAFSGGYEGGGAPVAGATSSSSSSKSSLQLGAGCLDKSAAGGSCTSCLSSYTQSFVLRGGACGALCV